MKNKKGFTLVELLSTIAVLAIILGIVSAAYVGISKHIRTTYYKSLEESLLVTGGEYFAYTSDRPQMYGDVKKVSLKDVIDLKYTTNVLDKRGNTCDLETSYLAAYKNSYDKTNYYVCLICSQDNYKTTSRECSGEVDYSLKMVPTKNDTGTIYREGEWVNKYVKLTFTTLNDVSKVEIKSDDKTYSCNMNDSGLRTCSVNVLESGNYKYYGITNNQETKTEYINIKVDRNNPDFIILENNGVVQDKVSKEITSSSVDVNVKVNDIKDLESGVKSIRYSFEKGDTKKYVNIESTNTSFEINKTLSLGLTNLIIEIEDFAGNTSTRKVVFEVYNKVNKPDSTYCNSLTYNGVEQVLTKSAGTGYTFINNKGTNAGSYEVSARLNDNYKWNDNSTEDVKFTCTINRQTTATLGICNSLTYNGATQVLAKGGNNVTIKNNEGKDAKAYMVMYVANSNYAFSDNTTTKYLSCSINKKVLTVTAKSNQSKIYGASDPTLTYNYSGNISGETPKFTGTLQRTAGENIGSYPINKGTLALANNGTFLANNYNLTFSGSTNFSIISKTIGSLTISLDNTSYTYDKTEKKPNVTIKDGSKTLTLNTDYTLSYSNNINAGTATVTITGKGNYKSSTTKNFTINKRSITVKANNQTINYGSSIATGVGYITVSNLVSGDTVTSITLTPSTSNVTTSGTITPSNISINNGSGNINYNPTYQKGTLVINSVEVCANIYINGASKIGSKTTDTKECCNSTNGSSCNITLPTITPKSGFTALGYSDDGDSLTSANYSANQSVTIYKPTGDAELPSYYAITRSISQNTYYATFNLNGATSTSSNKLSCTAGYAYNGDELPDECSITLPTITRSGWTIIGWSENSSSHTATYSQGQKITLHDDIDLFAITSKNVTLKYNTNSSTTVTTDNLTSKTETKTIYNTDGAMFNIPTYANGKVCRNNGGDKYHGYQLLGLSSNQSGNNVEFCFGDQIYLENDKTLFLVWQDKYATAVGNVGNNLKLRSGPGTDYPQLASIGKGDLVYIQSSKYTWRDGHTWYPVVYGSKIGWAAGNRKNNSTLSNLTLKSTPNADSCGYTYSCTSNNKLLSITPSDVVLNITSNTSKRKMQQNLSIANQCGSMTDAISSNSSLVTATKGGVISAVSGSVPVNQTKSATVTFKTKYGCTETVNVLVKNTEATAPDITISVNGDSSTCSGSYIKGATATVTCRSDLPITSYSAKIGSTSYAPSTSGNTYTSTINLSSTGSKTINVTCANAEGSSTQSKTVSVKVRNASSSCGCSVRYSASTAGSTCSRCTSWSKHSTGIQSASAIGAYKNYCTYSGGVGAFIKVTYTNWRGGANTAYVADMTIYKCTSFACKTYKTCCHT